MTDEWWQAAVAAAVADEEEVGVVLAALEETFRIAAVRHASQLIEDAMQAARLQVWRILLRVDLNRPTTIRRFLVKAGIRAMREEVRRYLRQTRGLRVMGDENQAIPDRPAPVRRFDFDPVLRLYLEHIEQTGSFVGAHKCVAALLGMKIPRVSSMFHGAARSFLEREGLAHVGQYHKKLIETLLASRGGRKGRLAAARGDRRVARRRKEKK